MPRLWLALLLAGTLSGQGLRISVYATAGGVLRYLSTPEGRAAAEAKLRRLDVTGIFLEGRRGDEYVPPDTLRAARDFFRSRGFRVAGGIATVPGQKFGVRQNEKLGWLNWQDPKTQREVATFFRENASIFDEIIVDDFYCTGDTSEMSARARGERSWPEYRQDLLTGLIRPMMVEPARPARLIIKYPQWYDRFHLYGYAPDRMSRLFDRVWVGTEVRNPATRRMGYVQPTEGYINFRWLSSVAGNKVEGAWFDHIECTAQNFVDQAYQSVLAGARELTLFQLGDVMDGHPGHELLIKALPELRALAADVADARPRGIPYYKPPGSEAGENMYLMDYLAMLGLPIVPVATYPTESRVAILGVQAAADAELRSKLHRHLATGATVMVTRGLGDRLRDLPVSKNLIVSELRTFSEQDFRDAGEFLLAPKPLDVVDMPRTQVDHLRSRLLAPLGMRLSAPSRIGFYLLGDRTYLYNFRDERVNVELNGKRVGLGANTLVRQFPADRPTR